MGADNPQCKQQQLVLSPAKETLHVLKEGVRPLPGRQALLPLVSAAHPAAAHQVSISVRTFDLQPLCDGIGGRARAGFETKASALLTLASSTGLPHPKKVDVSIIISLNSASLTGTQSPRDAVQEGRKCCTIRSAFASKTQINSRCCGCKEAGDHIYLAWQIKYLRLARQRSGLPQSHSSPASLKS